MAAKAEVSNDGKLFEGRVAHLLELRGVGGLVREKQLPSKKVDLYFEDDVFGRRCRFAVECKDYSRPLTKQQVEQIYTTYLACFAANEITDLLIVAPKPLTAGAQAYVDAIGALGFMTESDLRNSIIRFGGYLAGLKAKFGGSPVWNYHIPAQGRLNDWAGGRFFNTPNPLHSSLEACLLNQLDTGHGPFVVLGDYGIGKTTLAMRLFLALHDRWERDSSAPVPIYISLERMQQEQSLEGLLGTIFTSISPALGYNFNIFCALHEAGHFVIILDGIDEMRHKLNSEEFLYNIDQLWLLGALSRKTIILGRPSAFMDKDEYNYVVHGKSSYGSSAAYSAGLRPIEINLEMLDDEQIDQMIDAYCAWQHPRNSKQVAKIKALLASSSKDFVEDIIRRPIQLMMFLEIFPDLPRSLDRLSKSTVYSEFIDTLITRERAKQRSRKFSNADHRNFARHIAWWLWRQGGGSKVEAKTIEPELFAPFVRRDDDVEEVRRTLVAASFLSTEGGTRLHFPHRSIQEFLVAEQISATLRNSSLFQSFGWLRGRESDIFTPEVVDFLCVELGSDAKWKLICDFDRSSSIPPALRLLTRPNILDIDDATRRFRSRRSVAAAFLIMDEAIRRHASFKQGLGLSIRTALLKAISDTIDHYVAEGYRDAYSAYLEVSGYILCVMVSISSEEDGPAAPEPLLRIAQSLLEFGKPRKRGDGRPGMTPLALASEINPFFQALKQGVSSSGLSLRELYYVIGEQVAKGPVFKGWGNLSRPSTGRHRLSVELSGCDPSILRGLREAFAIFDNNIARSKIR